MNDEIDDDDDDNDSPAAVAAREIFVPGRRGPGRPRNPVSEDEPLINEEPLPIFPNATKREGQLAVSIQVYKLDPPGHGFKGTIPATADLNYVAQHWGDGNYTFEIINHKKQILKKREGVPINVGITHAEAVASQKQNTVSPQQTNTPNTELGSILHDLIEKLDRDRSRDDNQTKSLIDQARELARLHSEMVISTSKDAATRDHDYHKTQLLTQEKLFNTILASVSENSRVLMSQLEANHTRQQQWQDMTFKQTYTMIMGMHTHEKEMLREQLKFAQDNMGSEEGEPWEKALGMGIAGIKELRLLASTTKDISKKRAILEKVRLLKSTPEKGQNVGEKPNDNAEILRNRGSVMRRKIADPVVDAATEKTDESESESDMG
jgi:hypothetical protein